MYEWIEMSTSFVKSARALGHDGIQMYFEMGLQISNGHDIKSLTLWPSNKYFL